MKSAWDWLASNEGVVTITIAIISIFWSAYSYISIKKAEEKQRRFETYHRLVKDLVERDDPKEPMKLDRQLAVIFEMQNFPEYFSPSIKIVEGLRDSWQGIYGPIEKNNRLISQMDESLWFMKVRRSRLATACNETEKLNR